MHYVCIEVALSWVVELRLCHLSYCSDPGLDHEGDKVVFLDPTGKGWITSRGLKSSPLVRYKWKGREIMNLFTAQPIESWIYIVCDSKLSLGGTNGYHSFPFFFTRLALTWTLCVFSLLHLYVLLHAIVWCQMAPFLFQKWNKQSRVKCSTSHLSNSDIVTTMWPSVFYYSAHTLWRGSYRRTTKCSTHEGYRTTLPLTGLPTLGLWLEWDQWRTGVEKQLYNRGGGWIFPLKKTYLNIYICSLCQWRALHQ